MNNQNQSSHLLYPNQPQTETTKQFLFIFNQPSEATTFCCCSLEKGVIIIGYLFLFFSFLSIFSNSSEALLNIFSFTSMILLLIGHYQSNYKYVYGCVYIKTVILYFDFFKIVLGAVYLVLTSGFSIGENVFLVGFAFVLVFSLYFLIQIYFIWLFYSYFLLLKRKRV